MDGLEDQAEASLAGLLQQLYCDERVEIGRSSRDTVISHLAQELKSSSSDNGIQIVTKSLVFRGGISTNGLAMLQQGLEHNTTIEELQFVCLKSEREVQGAIDCCRRQPRIKSLSLISYTTQHRLGELRREILVAGTIRDSVFGAHGRRTFHRDGIDYYCQDDDEGCRSGIPTLQTLEIVGYPLGTRGFEILSEAVATNTTLTTLRLMDCDLRSDGANYVASMIKRNSHLKELDLSYNRHHLGSEIIRELTIKTFVQRGLRFNMSLFELKLDQTRGAPIQRSKIDRQLDVSKFRAAFVDSKRDPFMIPAHMWTHVLARVAVKPTALYLFLQESVVTLFR
jgi:hypothetical protein